MAKVVKYLTQQEAYKMQKRIQKKAQAEAVDKETTRAYAFDANNLFR